MIVIPIKMPNNCEECVLKKMNHWDGNWYCPFLKNDLYPLVIRNGECPLKEVGD